MDFHRFLRYFEALEPLGLHLAGSGHPPWHSGTIQSTLRVSLERSWAALGAPRASAGVLRKVPGGPWGSLGGPGALPWESLGPLFEGP